MFSIHEIPNTFQLSWLRQNCFGRFPGLVFHHVPQGSANRLKGSKLERENFVILRACAPECFCTQACPRAFVVIHEGSGQVPGLVFPQVPKGSARFYSDSASASCLVSVYCWKRVTSPSSNHQMCAFCASIDLPVTACVPWYLPVASTIFSPTA